MAEQIASNNTTCYDFSKSQYIALVSIRSGIGFISFIACIVVIALMILLKKYLFRPQRMVLYLNITLLLNSLVTCMNSISYKESQNLPIYCLVTGLLDEYTSLCILLAVTCFTVNIFVQVMFNYKTGPIAEALYVLFIFGLPIIPSMIPIYFNAYGFSGAWCWIKEFDEDCVKFKNGIILQFSLLYVPIFILYPILFLMLFVTLCYVRHQRYRYEAQVDLQAPQINSQLRKEIKTLLWYPCVILLLMAVPLAVRIAQAAQGNSNDSITVFFVLWLFDSLFTTTKGLIIALIFTFDKETRERLTFGVVKGACCNLFWRRRGLGRIQEYPATLNVSSDSRRSSFVANSADFALDKSSLLSKSKDDNEDSGDLTSRYYQFIDDD